MRSCENDIEYLHIVTIAFISKGESEILEFANRLLKSKYHIERNLAISLLIWFGDEKAIATLENLVKNDNSEYVKIYAKWGIEVANQEKNFKEIYEEILQEAFEESPNYELISAKLWQIEAVLTPTYYVWVNDLHNKYKFYESCKDKYIKAHISRFWNRIHEKIKDNKKIKVFGRELHKYYRGEEISEEFEFIKESK